MFGTKLLTLLVIAPTINKHKFHYGSAMIPHPRKIKRGGEDALFTTNKKLGIFDGVSAWMEEDGIDAGIYALSLSEIAKDADEDLNPSEMLENAVANTTVTGSATTCVVSLDDDLKLEICNVGDSGFLLLRQIPIREFRWFNFLWYLRQFEREEEYFIVAKSVPMIHAENHPFQLGSEDAPTRDNIPESSFMKTKVGDIIILGTDGLFDNLSETEILHCVNKFSTPKHLAWKLAYKAQQKYDKVDDISVIVAKIT